MAADNNKKKDLKSERVKLHFAETAKKIILEDGVEAVSVRKVANLAGYSFTTIYNHFKSIDELLWYTRNIMILDIFKYMQNSAGEKIDSIAGVKSLFKTYLDYFIENPNIFRFFYFHHLDTAARPVENIMDEIDFNKQYTSNFEFLFKSEQFSTEEIKVLIKTLIYSVHGMLTLFISDNDDLRVEAVYKDINEIIDLLLRDFKN